MKVRGQTVPTFALLMLFIMVGVLAYIIFQRGQALSEQYAPPVRYTARPDLVQPPVCPGDTLRYEYGLEVLLSALPIALTIDRGIWSVARQDFVVPSTESVTYPYNRPVSIRRVRTYTVPLRMADGEPFPPGKYELMVTGEAESRKTVGFSIPFSIKPSVLCNR